MPENRQMTIASIPAGPLQASHFALRTGPAPAPGNGQVLCRTLAITIGAGQRARLQGVSYAAAAREGEVMDGSGVARVEASNAPAYAAGDLVAGRTGWQDYAVLDAADIEPVEAGTDPALQLGGLGINGLTAYFGLLDVGAPQPGDTVVVSAAAGSVGHIAGQIAKLRGCHVIGVAGSPAKCALLTDELGFDTALSYKDPGFRGAFREATPDGVDVYFDNTGGEVLGSALRRMNVKGRIVCCGVVSQYDTANPAPAPRGIPGLLISSRVRMEGFLVFDYADRYAEARRDIREWAGDGQLKLLVSEFQGLDAAPQAFVDLLAGATTGTTVVRL
ncbi:MAG: NADP-dependent oxidoreductase [Chloroflexi bacterium]|nr:NADP-dependent oxidoreductase [Chloroflexota bacterium]